MTAYVTNPRGTEPESLTGLHPLEIRSEKPVILNETKTVSLGSNLPDCTQVSITGVEVSIAINHDIELVNMSSEKVPPVRYNTRLQGW